MQEGNQSFVDVYHPASHEELAVLRLALDAAAIHHFVKNEYATLGSRGAIGSDQLAIMVEAARADEAGHLIRSALGVGRTPQ